MGERPGKRDRNQVSPESSESTGIPRKMQNTPILCDLDSFNDLDHAQQSTHLYEAAARLVQGQHDQTSALQRIEAKLDSFKLDAPEFCDAVRVDLIELKREIYDGWCHYDDLHNHMADHIESHQVGLN